MSFSAAGSRGHEADTMTKPLIIARNRFFMRGPFIFTKLFLHQFIALDPRRCDDRRPPLPCTASSAVEARCIPVPALSSVDMPTPSTCVGRWRRLRRLSSSAVEHSSRAASRPGGRGRRHRADRLVVNPSLICRASSRQRHVACRHKRNVHRRRPADGKCNLGRLRNTLSGCVGGHGRPKSRHDPDGIVLRKQARLFPSPR